MPKIVVVDVQNVDEMIGSLNHDQLEQMYFQYIQNPFYSLLLADATIKDTEFKNFEMLIDETNTHLLLAEISKVPKVILLEGKEQAFTAELAYQRVGDTIKTIYNQVFTAGDIEYEKYTFSLSAAIRFLIFHLAVKTRRPPIFPIPVFPPSEETKAKPPQSEFPWLAKSGFISVECTNSRAAINRIKLLTNNPHPKITEKIIKEIKIKNDFRIDMSAARSAKNTNLYMLTSYQNIIRERFTKKRAQELEQHYKNPKDLIDKLTPIEHEKVEQEFRRREEYMTKNITCDHLKLYRKLRKTLSITDKKAILKKLERFMPQRYAPGLITCELCGFPLICSHVIELINLTGFFTSSRKIRESLKTYIDFSIESDKYFCKYCGELLYDEEIMDTAFGTSIQMEETPIGEVIWQELKYALNGMKINIDTKDGLTINPEKFIQQSVATLTPWLEVINRVSRKNVTLSENHLNAIMSIYASIYVHVLLFVLSKKDPLIDMVRPNLKKKSLDKDNIKIMADYISSVKAPAVQLLNMPNADIRSKISSAFTIMMNASAGLKSITDTSNIYEIFEETQLNNPVLQTLGESIQEIFHQSTKTLLTKEKANIYESLVVPNYINIKPDAEPKFLVQNLKDAYLKLLIEYLKYGYWQDLQISPKIKERYDYLQKLSLRKSKYLWARRGLPTNTLIRPFIPSKKEEPDLSKIYDNQGNKYHWNVYIFGDKEFSIKELSSLIGKGENPIEKLKITDLKSKDILQSTLKENPDIPGAIKMKHILIEFYQFIAGKCSHDWSNGACKKCKITKEIEADSFNIENGLPQKSYDDLIKYYNQNKVEIPKVIESVEEVAIEFQPAKIDWKKNSSIIHTFADMIQINENELKAEVQSRDDPALLNIIMFVQTIMTDYDNLKIAMDLSKQIPATKNKIEEFRELFKIPKVPDIPNLYNLVIDALYSLEPQDVYQYTLELIATTFVNAPELTPFIQYEINDFLKLIKNLIMPKFFNNWSLLRPNMGKFIKPDVNEEIQDEVPTEEDALANQFDMDMGADDNPEAMEDNLEMPE